MKKTKRQPSKSKAKTLASKRLGRAKADYEKTICEIEPFLPKTKIEDVSTVGRWQTTATLFRC